ncbi:MAG TPA: NAD(P)/FAD-dependent oxidoreductase [Sphingomonas sp.]|jgi:NADH dehydrogenase FAD-containing subunit|nr:NAD(P)/FAD-dependent oxidoreductase [Sphingomonas sp.]
MPSTPPSVLPHVVVIGAGFGGLAVVRRLARRPVRVTLVDRQNHHLFQPLLYQVATAGLSPADIAAPIRSIVKDVTNVAVLMDEVVGVDPAARSVRLASSASLDYDALVVATGARHSYFGQDAWEAHAPGIKTIDDALRVRRDLLLAMEREETRRQEEPGARSEHLTFAVIGGGPTGVEMAGAIAELTRHAADMDFRHITRNCVKVVLVEGGPRLLAGFPDALSTAALQHLASLDVDVRLNARVTSVVADGIEIAGDFLPTAATIWAAGVKASPAAEWLSSETDRSGRVVVDGHLSVAGKPDVFVIGDTAAVVDAKGCAVPGIAPAAKQQGDYVARVIMARLETRRAPAPFRYRDYGKLATVGRKRAVADFGWLRLSGFPAWALWSTAHLYFLVGFRNRLVVGANWMWNYLTFERGARLITGLRGSM